jgi:cysteine desulfurase
MIYWDHNSTTPCAPEVIAAMQRYWNEDYGNPSSSHIMGRRAAVAVKNAREQVAGLANALPSEIVFTAGATESNNLLFLGILLSPRTERNRIVVSAIEHKSVLEPASLLEEHGFEVVKLPVSRTGVTDVEAARKLITQETLLVSVQAANNELGTLQPAAELAEIAHENGAYFHTDAAQVLGKVPFDVQAVNCDFASFSAHKMYGPKGIGALFVRGGARRWPWAHPFRGGGQESGLRPGTSNVPAIVGFGEACVLASTTLKENGSYLSLLSGRFHRELTAVVSNAQLINDLDASLPGTLSIILPGVSADILIAHCKKINISRGSACNGAIGSSHVLNEVVQDEHLKESVIRVSFGKDSSAESFHEFFEILEKIKLGAVGNE